MMKLKLSLKNSVRPALLFSLLICFNLTGCQCRPIEPTYKEENLISTVKQICKDEYSLDVATGRTPTTLWVYAPVDKILHKDYGKQEDKIFDDEITEKLRNILITIGRVLLSSDHTPEFFVLVISDIKIGIDYAIFANVLDIKKTYADSMPFTETQKRYVFRFALAPQAIGDKTGKHIQIYDIKLGDFLAQQITQRVSIIFQGEDFKKYFKLEKIDGLFNNGNFIFAYSIRETTRPDKGINAMKEILDTAAYCIRTYEFGDFNTLEINDLLRQDKLILNRQEILTRPLSPK
ncbi:MAG: hypothetical protein PHC54_05100 [Candidatus Omnitrophica bacterium]|nr:hypothetical protein [Candidatus Omnitrophota bacterium]MDD5592721.1 hypothetical protein [Candidatus Omnitrophota bacterium]